MGGTTTWQGMTVPISGIPPNPLFPGVCKKANGDVIMVTPRMTHHLYGDGEIWSQTGSDNGDGTVTWRADWTKIYASKGSTWDVRGSQPSLVPSGPHAGKVVVSIADTNWLASLLRTDYLSPWPTVSVQCFCRILISTDATCTAWTELATLPPAFPAIAPNCNDFPECPIQFLPNGDWMVATYSRETHDYIGWYSAAYFRSTDNGANWTHEGFVARADTSNPDPELAEQADEPQLLMLQNGEMICVIRWLDTAVGTRTGGYRHKLYRCSNPTDRGAMVWVDEGDCTTSPAGSRPALLQHSNGMVMHAYRVVYSNTSCQGVYRSSNDDAATWTAERNLDNGNLTSGNSGTGVYSYGQWVELSNGGLIHPYSQDGLSASVRQARLSVVSDAYPAAGYGNTVSGGYGAATAFSASAASLTITPNAEWTQAGPLITVATEGLSTVQASVSTPAAGSVFFDGADEGLFSASLDGLAWAGVVPVGAGNTPITLRINPSAAGTFTARVGVAV